MHKTILTAGIALLLAGIAMPGAAYHIAGSPVPVHACTQATLNGDALTTHHWCIAVPSLILCEQEDLIGDGSGIPSIGYGGLCYMSAGHGDTDCESLHDQPPGPEPDSQVDEAGRSDGWGYSGGSLQGEQPNPVCPTRPSKDAPNDWYSFNMTGTDNTDVVWTAQAGPAQCDVDVHNIANLLHEELVVDELFLYWADNGHLAGFVDPSVPPNPATYGTYDVDFAAEPTVAPCDSTLPGAPMYIVA